MADYLGLVMMITDEFLKINTKASELLPFLPEEGLKIFDDLSKTIAEARHIITQKALET